MTCDFYRSLIQGRVDGLLDEAIVNQMRQHEDTCADCKSLLDQMTVLRYELASLDEDIEMPDSFQKSWRHSVRREAFAHKTRSFTRAFASVAAGVMLFAGIGSGMNALDQAPINFAAQKNYEPNSYLSMPRNATQSMDIMLDESAPMLAGGEAVQEQKIIKNANISLSTVAYDDALAKISELTAQHGGSEQSSNQWGGEADAARTASIRLSVPAESLESILESIKQLGKVTSLSTESTDVTTQYTDTDARLASATARRDRLNELIAKAETLTDLIELETALSSAQYEIDSLTQSIRSMDQQIALSSLNVNVTEVLPTDAAREGDDGLWARMKLSITDSVSSGGAFLSDVVVFLTGALPWLAAAAILLLIAHRVIKHKRK